MVFVAVGLLAGCTPEPLDADPTPTFTSEAEAFAAAEATYRAYVDALNDVDLSDPETFEAVYSWTTGEANAGERKSLSKMHADGWTVEGETAVRQVSPSKADLDPGEVIALEVCADVSGVEVFNEEGESMVSPERPDEQSAVARFVSDSHAPHGLLISALEGSDFACTP